jgi:predicted RNase H-like HicB family nuclease
MKDDVFDGYTVNLMLDEDGQYLAHFIEMPNVSAFGNTPEEALHELENAWTLMKEDYAANNDVIPVAPLRRQYSGTFNVRVGKKMHKELAMEAFFSWP